MLNDSQRYKVKSDAGLRDTVGGRKVGEHRRLGGSHEAIMQHPIFDKTPDHLEMANPLRMHTCTANLTKQWFGARLPVPTIG